MADHNRIERAARCPACAREVDGLVIRIDGKLKIRGSGVAVLGFVCPHCGREIRWGYRKSGARIPV